MIKINSTQKDLGRIYTTHVYKGVFDFARKSKGYNCTLPIEKTSFIPFSFSRIVYILEALIPINQSAQARLNAS